MITSTAISVEISVEEKVSRLLALCNKFKDRVLFYEKECFYEYANVCWALAYFYSRREQISGLEMIYEDAGDDPHYDLLGLKIGSEYACIPVPLVCPTVVGTFAKSATIVDKYDHKREKPNTVDGLTWEELAPDLTFLALYTCFKDRSILVSTSDLKLILINQPHQIIPENLQIYGKRGDSHNPVHDEKFFREYKYSGFTFKSWITLEDLFQGS